MNQKTLIQQLVVSEKKRSRLQILLRKQDLENDDNHFLWSVVDLMTLLLLFFILLYAKTFPLKPPVMGAKAPVIRNVPIPQKPVPKVKEAKPILKKRQTPSNPSFTYAHYEIDMDLDDFRNEIRRVMRDHDTRMFSTRMENGGLVLVLNEAITFSKGEAHLLTRFQAELRKVAQLIAAKTEYRIIVAGHTDDTPIHTREFPSNWELSAARAVNVAKFLIQNQVAPDRISIQGFAEYQSLYDPAIKEYHQLNRRVEITLMRK